MAANGESSATKKIVVQKDGPYRVCGGIPLVRKVQVVSEYGEPLTWDGRDARGRALPTGVYFCTIESGGSSTSRKIVLSE